MRFTLRSSKALNRPVSHILRSVSFGSRVKLFPKECRSTRWVESPVRIYGPEKTVADCFKHRNKIGIDVALEALKTYRRRKSFNADKLLHSARVCRVEKIMRPYLETLL